MTIFQEKPKNHYNHGTFEIVVIWISTCMSDNFLKNYGKLWVSLWENYKLMEFRICLTKGVSTVFANIYSC